MPESSEVGDHAADLVGLEVRVGHPRRRLCLSGISERAIILSLMRSVLVIVREVVLQGTLQTIPADAPTTADAFTFHRTDPALGKGIQVWAAWWDGHGFDAAGGQSVLPGGAEFGVSVVDQVARSDLGQPASVGHGQVACRLDHEPA